MVVFVVLRMLPVDPLAMLLPPHRDRRPMRPRCGSSSVSTSPIPQQFLIWLWEALTGNLGTSINFRQPVTS